MKRELARVTKATTAVVQRNARSREMGREVWRRWLRGTEKTSGRGGRATKTMTTTESLSESVEGACDERRVQ
jgi:hypothetical protein